VRFVDEYRNGDLAKRVVEEITGLVEPGRQYKLMEVCGGHTHTIYKHGVENVLPPEVDLIHGPGCPVCVIPMGRVDDAIAIAERPNAVGNGSLLEAKARGATSLRRGSSDS